MLQAKQMVEFDSDGYCIKWKTYWNLLIGEMVKNPSQALEKILNETEWTGVSTYQTISGICKIVLNLTIRESESNA